MLVINGNRLEGPLNNEFPGLGCDSPDGEQLQRECEQHRLLGAFLSENCKVTSTFWASTWVWIHLARTAQATTSLLTALGSWQVLYCRRGKPGEADFLDNDLSRDILITHGHISRVLNTGRDALPSPSTAVRYEEREQERERSHIVTFLYNVCTVFLGTLLDTGVLGSVYVSPLGTERSGENAHNLNSFRTAQTAALAHLTPRDLGEEGTGGVTMRRKGGRAVGQARAAAVAQLFLSKDSRPREQRTLPLLSRLRQPHQRQHPLPSQAPLDPPPFLSFTCDCSPLPLHPSSFKSAIQLKRSWPGGKRRLVNAQHLPGTPKGIGCFWRPRPRI